MKTANKNNLRAYIVKKVAEKEGVTKRYVYMVLAGERENQAVLDRYMIAKECVETALTKAAKELVPIN